MSTEFQSTQFRLIPLRQLDLSPLNIRKTAAEEGIEQLAELIGAEGVLQNLSVHECPQAAGAEEMRYAVVAGGRRWRALKQLLKQGRITPEHPVPSLIVSYERAVQISLAENSGREPMHSADEFEAFRRLVDAGQGIEDIAARFGVTPIVVQRRLKLANVSPKFITLYREGEMTLEHLMAFAVTDDQERQEQVWKGLKAYERTPDGIRRALTQHEVSARACIARFVGIKAYEKAGGAVRRDLFEEEGTMLDGDLVRRLASEKLEKHAKRLKVEGLAWVEVRPEFDYADRAAYGRVRTTPRARSGEEQGQLDTLRATREEIQARAEAADAEDEAYETLVAQLEDLESQIAALEEQCTVPDPEQQALAGAVVSIGRNGKVSIERDLLRPEDAERFEHAQQQAGRAALSEAPHLRSARLVERLTAQRTIALQAELVQQPMTAVIALTHRLVLATFYAGAISRENAVRIKAGSTGLSAHAAELEGTAAQETLAAHRKRHEEALPGDPEDLLAWLIALSGGDLLALLAYCVAVRIDGVQAHEGACPTDALAKAAKLDMHRWWKPTAENYFGSIPKSQILAAITEAVSASAAASVAKLKKDALAQAAEREVSGTNWLPTLMRDSE